jgi:hypothetical protein
MNLKKTNEMHNSLKIIKTLLYSYSALRVSGTCAHHQEPPNSAHTASSHRVSLGWLYLPAYATHSTLKPVPTLPR